MPNGHKNTVAKHSGPERRIELPKTIFQSTCSHIARNLEFNLRNILEHGSLGPEEALLALLTISIAAEFEPLCKFAFTELQSRGVADHEIDQAREIAPLMTLMNTYYIFRNASKKATYTRPHLLDLDPQLQALFGQKRFEMLAAAISIVNQSEHGIICHETAARDRGATSEQIEDLARLVAIVRSIRVLAFDAKCQLSA